MAGAQAPPAFVPLTQWANAVRGGDAASITGFYATDPPPVFVVSTGIFTGVQREAAFWAAWHAQHLSRIDIDLITNEPVNAGLRQIGFEAGIYFQTATGPQSLFLFVEQTWRRQDGHWRIIGGGRTDLARLQQPTSLAGSIFSKSANAHADIAAALRRAAAEHKRVLLDFGGNWCYDCHVLDMAFHRSDLAPLLQANYEVVNVDVENFDDNLDIVRQYHLSIAKGVPMLAVLDSSGKVLVSSANGAFEAARVLGPDQLIAFLTAWKPGRQPRDQR
jgi:ketosteroid isomerase-like protein